ncbi:acyl carrier protein phosphodiesterase [Flavobacterium sp.]|uniref:acyl carrier protein phosphodiesterase n=1 Tax=Flavobacterium sp. TaxID=239 RepID=UPI00260870B1|nr:acyl carrier protein phosphodiesterase [Flavobacterium sp.]MDD2986681.1 acyl carrier protein phosphodiesterase [Flavobacterium sp.]
MNFLAHIYLSGENELIQIGNFMADSIRGKSYTLYSPPLIKGILLHREIDTFTDAHPIFRKSKHRLHEKYGHYSGVIMDIFYDHFLAKNWANYSSISLEQTAEAFYDNLQRHYDLLTEPVKKMMPYLISQNWLISYSTLEGLSLILYQMDHRTKKRVAMHESIVELNQFYAEFESEFTAFFEEIKIHCQEKLATL